LAYLLKVNSTAPRDGNRRQTNYKRSDAGISIVQEVFGFVKKNRPKRRAGRALPAGKGRGLFTI
jgi:hypothetical protein